MLRLFLVSLLIFPAFPSGLGRDRLLLEADPDGFRTLEIGYANGFEWKKIVGGHIWVKLRSFDLAGERIERGELDVNRFVIRMPYDPMALHGKRVSTADGTLIHGEGGRITIRHAGGRLQVEDFEIEFRKMENWVFRGIMAGKIRIPGERGMLRAFALDVPLELQFGYGAPDGFPGPQVIRDSLELMADQELPVLLNRGYWTARGNGDWREVLLRLEFDRAEDFDRWMGKLQPLAEGDYFALFESVDPLANPEGKPETNRDPFAERVVDPFAEAKARADMSRVFRGNGPAFSTRDTKWWFGEKDVKRLEFFRLPKPGVYGYLAAEPGKKRIYLCGRSAR